MKSKNRGGPEPAHLVNKITELFVHEDSVPQDERDLVQHIATHASHWYLSPAVMELINHTDITESAVENKQGYVEIELRLPFEFMTLEYHDIDVDFCVFAGARPDDELFVLHVFIRKSATQPIGYLGAIVGTPTSLKYVDPLARDESHVEDLGDPEKAGQTRLACLRSLGVLLRLVRVLECDNAPVREIPEPAKLNKKREARGKLKIPRYRTLHISDHRTRKTPVSLDKGTHASPRTHWRRGHIRHMTVKGQEVKRWIKPTIVGGGTAPAPDIKLT
jgi:hypothetical protein